MKTIEFYSNTQQILADTVTPVSVYLRLRTLFPKSILLESSDYRGHENARSFICFSPMACFSAQDGVVTIKYPDRHKETFAISAEQPLHQLLDQFYKSFRSKSDVSGTTHNGLFGYLAYDAVRYFEKIELNSTEQPASQIPEAQYCFYKYIVAIDHHKNRMSITENLLEGEKSQMEYIHHLLVNPSYSSGAFSLNGEEQSNLSDEQYKHMVSKGKEHCYRGDVFQIVLSRQFSQAYNGDDFIVYRALRSINPSPYLFYFDYGDYRILGSSPEAELRIQNNRAIINPIAGTFRRTGNDEQDKLLAEKLCLDPKENAEHVMLVDLARNDLSRNASGVKVDSYREVQYFSHVIHLVSEVSGQLAEGSNMIRVLGDSFPAGTLSGAPKHRAMQLIDHYENQRRGFYGGCIGFIGFDQSLNHAIMIRSFLSKEQTLYYQAGAGVVADSKEESELQEVNNKLAALRKAIDYAQEIN